MRLSLPTIALFALVALTVCPTLVASIWCDDDNCYTVLGVNATATPSEVKKAYFKSSLKWHPDKNPSEEAKGEFSKLARAYEILSEARRREDYDYALAHPEQVMLNRARFYRDKYFNSGYMQVGITHIFLGLVVMASMFQYMNMVANYHSNFDEFKLTSQGKTERKRIAAEMAASSGNGGGSGNGNGNGKAGKKPRFDAAVDKAVDAELRRLLIAGGSLLVPTVRRVALVQLFTVPFAVVKFAVPFAAKQASWYYRYSVRKQPYSPADRLMLTEKTLSRLDGGAAWEGMGDAEREAVSTRDVWVPANFQTWLRETEKAGAGGKRRQQRF
mmetsp:Transcript_36170/g.89123  ORF Transcript_36170/g.89123 Transcript_36170/m.89123 type:complete len:329 (+) Transcript_36170:164-1150(+)|eukprot:CAMPEP_0197578338 /NCGR_PEP_ID=MMETSP1326-20131121/2594_1 /TAXON_ID=1155430 /ORGANISM="Genus nov. species nov., Strain RCC2288" /LENGTH=328 /DNA_ID=CAMNT_0043141507 /DNA_START=147 /DNA_END=1133 /DNA_ORIENTATION=-